MAEIVLTNRRRPGRTHVDQALIPLLRNPVGDGVCAIDVHDDHHATADMHEGDIGRGIIFGLLFSLPAWALIIEAIRLVVR